MIRNKSLGEDLGHLRERLKKYQPKVNTNRNSGLSSPLPSIFSKQAFPVIERPLSRDVSFIRDSFPKTPSQYSIRKKALIQTLSSFDIPEVSERQTKLEPIHRSKDRRSIENRFEDAMREFIQSAKHLNPEGLKVYKHYGLSVVNQLKNIYEQEFDTSQFKKKKLDQARPSGIREAQLLSNWMDQMLSLFVFQQEKPLYQKIQASHLIFRVSLKEIIRQVSVQCNVRGKLLEKVSKAMIELSTLNQDSSNLQNLSKKDIIEHTQQEYKHLFDTKYEKVRQDNMKLTLTFKGQEKRVTEIQKQRDQLFRDLQAFKKRTEFLEKELENQKKALFTQPITTIQTQTDFILKKHADCQTCDNEFLMKTKFIKQIYHTVGEPIIVTGYFQQNNLFRKTAAYRSENNSIVPYDFPGNLLKIPKCVDVQTNTQHPNQIKKQPTKQIQPIPVVEQPKKLERFQSRVPMSILVGLFSLSLTKQAYAKHHASTQFPQNKQILSIYNGVPIQIHPWFYTKPARIGTRKQSKVSQSGFFDDSKLMGSFHFDIVHIIPANSQRNKASREINSSRSKKSLAPSRASSLRSAISIGNSSMNSDIKSITPEVRVNSNFAILADEMARFSHCINEMMTNGASYQEFLQDEQCKIQSRKVKQLIESFQKKSEDNRLQANYLSPAPRKYNRNNSWNESFRSEVRLQMPLDNSMQSSRISGSLLDQLSLKTSLVEQIPQQRSFRLNYDTTNEQQSIYVNHMDKSVQVNIQESKSPIIRRENFKPVKRASVTQLAKSVSSSNIPGLISKHPIFALAVPLVTREIGNIYNSKNHPGPKLLINYVQQLKHEENLICPLTVNALVRIINKTLAHKLLTCKDSSKGLKLTASMALYDVMIKQYGLKVVAETKFRQVILATLSYFQKNPRVQFFSQCLELTGETYLEDLNFYVQATEYLNNFLPSNMNQTNEFSKNNFVAYFRLIDFVQYYFYERLKDEDFRNLIQELEEIKRVIPKQIDKIDYDVAILILLKYFRVQIVQAQKKLSSLKSWTGDSEVDFNLFREVIQEIQKEVFSEQGLINYFQKTKEYGEEDIISSNSLCVFLIENKLVYN